MCSTRLRCRYVELLLNSCRYVITIKIITIIMNIITIITILIVVVIVIIVITIIRK